MALAVEYPNSYLKIGSIYGCEATSGPNSGTVTYMNYTVATLDQTNDTVLKVTAFDVFGAISASGDDNC